MNDETKHRQFMVGIEGSGKQTTEEQVTVNPQSTPTLKVKRTEYDITIYLNDGKEVQATYLDITRSNGVDQVSLFGSVTDYVQGILQKGYVMVLGTDDRLYLSPHYIQEVLAHKKDSGNE